VQIPDSPHGYGLTTVFMSSCQLTQGEP
jgi:hypothetical protein